MQYRVNTNAASPAATSKPGIEVRPVAALADVLGAERVVVAFNDERVAVLDPAGGALAIVSRDDFYAALGATPFAGHDVKPLYRGADERGVDLAEPADDTAIMAFLVDAISGHYGLAEVAHRFLGEPLSDERPSLFSAASDELLTRDVVLIGRLLIGRNGSRGMCQGGNARNIEQ